MRNGYPSYHDPVAKEDESLSDVKILVRRVSHTRDKNAASVVRLVQIMSPRALTSVSLSHSLRGGTTEDVRRTPKRWDHNHIRSLVKGHVDMNMHLKKLQEFVQVGPTAAKRKEARSSEHLYLFHITCIVSYMASPADTEPPGELM